MDIESPHGTGVRARLSALVHSNGPFDLVEAALVVACERYPDLDVSAELRKVDDLGVEAARRIEGLTNPFARLDGLRAFLFEEHGFRGNTADYYDPRNSYINDVLARRLGIPITLSLIYMAVAERCGYEARGVGLPGHFVVRLDHDGRTHLVDPFAGGEVITEGDCRDLVIRATGKPALFRADLLAGADPVAILSRLLRNLKAVLLTNGDHGRALGVVEMLRTTNPGDTSELRDRGFLLAHLGRPGAALEDLESYLSLAPDAPDAPAVRSRLGWLRRRVTQIN